MTEMVAAETPISAEGMRVGDSTASSEPVAEFGGTDKGNERQDGEWSNGVDGAEGVSSGNGPSQSEKEVAPCSVRRRANKGEVLGE